MIGGIKKKFSEYKKPLKPSLQLTYTPVVSMMNLGTNSKYNIVTPSKVIKTSKEEDPMPTPKLMMTSSVTGHESMNTKCQVKIYVDENTILERLMIEHAKTPAPTKGKELSKCKLSFFYFMPVQ